MRKVVSGKQFRKDVKRLQKRGKDLRKLDAVIAILANNQKLESKHRPHRLSGDMIPYWDVHIEPDWLLIYHSYDNVLELYRTGTHSDIF